MKREVVLFSILILLFAIFPFVFAADPPEIDNAYTCLNEKINSSGCASLSFEEKIFSSLATGKCINEISNLSSQNQCWPSGNCDIKLTAQALLSLYNYDDDYNTTAGEEWLLSRKTIPSDLQWLLEIESNEATTCSIYYEGNEAGLSLTIGEDKKISSSNLGNCFTFSTGNYFLEISPECYNMDLDISCDKGFLTTLLFKKQGSSTINVLDETQEASAKGFATEKVNSWCFSNPSLNSCDYEASLWASEILFYLDRDVSAFLPYLIAFSEENSDKLPESFLYYLTGKYRNELLLKQVANNKYWIVSGDEYYDTALALLPLQYESPIEKTNSKNWLLDRQEESGCWDNGNLRNTAFILYSVWPRNIGGEPVEETVCGDGDIEGDEECEGTNLDGESCESLGFSDESGDLKCYAKGTSRECEFDKSECIVPTECDENNPCPDGYECSTGGQCLEISEPDYECETDDDCKDGEVCSSSNICVEETLDCEPDYGFCMSAIDCDGTILKEYDCSGLSKCCSVDKSYGTCRSQGGEICNTDSETCDGYKTDADNLLSDEICCIGDCEEKSSGGEDEYLCEDNDGTCRTSCLSDEKESSFYDCDFGEVCCLEDKKSGSNWFIWLLVVLILLVVLGIVFRDKLREIFMKLKTKFKKGKGSGKGLKPLFLPKTPPSGPGQRPMPPRRIIPPSQRPNPPRTPPQKTKKSTASKELDDVLKKLRDLGNK